MAYTSGASPAISIIVPVYNAKKYIDHCVGSLVAQTFRDIEIILINDCSSDGSLDKLHQWAQRDGRVHVIDLPVNEGDALARNRGLAVACGDWIAFVDSDDWVDSCRYGKMYDYAQRYNVDAVLDGYDGIYGNGIVKYRKPMSSVMRVLSGRQMIEEMFFGKISAFAPWHGIYRHAVIEEGFHKVRSKDAMFNFEFFARAQTVCLLTGCSYHYRELDVSVSHGYCSPDSRNSLKGVEACAAYLKNNDKLRRLVPDFDEIADMHLLNEYAIVAGNTCSRDCPETFAQRREFLGKIAESRYFRPAYENAAARGRLRSRKRRFLSLLYARDLSLAAGYMYVKGQWKKVEALFKK